MTCMSASAIGHFRYVKIQDDSEAKKKQTKEKQTARLKFDISKVDYRIHPTQNSPI